MSSDADLNRKCIELALEGERRCRAGDTPGGVAYLEAALTAGTDDLKTLSAIYSQLGNAYFYLGDYGKALEYHRHDLTLARTIGDRLGEAKASGNLGNTLKVLGKYDEAVACCQRHLHLSRELGDKVGEGRALYNLGNVFHAKGKHTGRLGHGEPGDVPQEVRHALNKAVEYYKQNLAVVEEINDRAAQGRACGNLGNTLYLLGDFHGAVEYHNKRLAIAKEYGDKPAMRRAYSNLGNAHVFLGEFEIAFDYYSLALAVAMELGDSATEAQACYSLGNTCTLLGQYTQAADYHLKHLSIARKLGDKVGQARASWSLGNAYTSIGEHRKAFYFVSLHMQLSREIGDEYGEVNASQNLADLMQILGPNPVPDSSDDPEPEAIETQSIVRKVRRRSMENLNMVKLNAECKNDQFEDPEGYASVSQYSNFRPQTLDCAGVSQIQLQIHTPDEVYDEDSFLELLMKSQSKRMDDQRCDPRAIQDNKENRPRIRASDNVRAVSARQQCPDDVLEMIAGIQGRRMNDQRAELSLPGLQNPRMVLGPHIAKRKQMQQQQQDKQTSASSQQLNVSVTNGKSVSGASGGSPRSLKEPTGAAAKTSPTERTSVKTPDEDFFEMLMRCQGSRIEEQRSELPKSAQSGVTVPDDDLFQVVMKMQAGRIEEQRAHLHKSDVPLTAKASEESLAPHKRTSSQKLKKNC